MALFDILRQSFPPSTKFTAEQVPDLANRVYIVTGGNSGVGKETVRVGLLQFSAVTLVNNSLLQAEEAIKELKGQTGKDAIFLELDLGDLKSVKASAAEFLSKEPELHVLFNNGGVMMPPIEDRTADGYDLQVDSRPFFFTKLLLPALLAGAKSSADGKARVVNTASGMHLMNNLDFKIIMDDKKRKKAGSQLLYSLSKFALVALSAELARRYGEQNIVVTSLHPGVIKTDLHRHMTGALGSVINVMEKTVLHDVSHGALTQLYAGTTVEGAQFNGKYLIPWARIGKPHPGSQDPKLGSELWDWLDEQVKPFE
ncbi:hypothetical protein C8R46DRAFT_1070384 [Mycena filopes]|nr:hypothetical protein C8R46DRAFT_1070384 [Mycena filopes]